VAERDRSPDLRVDAQRDRLDLDLRSVMSGQSEFYSVGATHCLALFPHPLLRIGGRRNASPASTSKRHGAYRGACRLLRSRRRNDSGHRVSEDPATENEGVRLLGIAYCKGVPGAIELFERSHKYKKPAQCEG
jgi:hypothetical protein